MENNTINILAISGSLKSTSTNTNILRAIRKLVPDKVNLTILNGLDILPHFNPESIKDIESVNNFRQQLKYADGVIFSTPEYAFGVPGVLKNALDWVVATGELNEKPVVVISASPLYSGGNKALTSLILTLTALGTKMDDSLTLSIPNIKSKITDAGELTDDETISDLQLIIDGFLKLISLHQ